MGKHRPSDLLLTQAMEEVKRLQLRVAQDALATNPQMKQLASEKGEIRKSLLKVDRWLKEGNGGLTHRIARLSRQSSEADTNLATAKEQKSALLDKLEDVEARMSDLAGKLLEG